VPELRGAVKGSGFDLGVRHHGEWERPAIVTDQEWLARAARLFAWMIPGEARVFPRSRLEQARPGSRAPRPRRCAARNVRAVHDVCSWNGTARRQDRPKVLPTSARTVSP
jgi:hypothetical protein